MPFAAAAVPLYCVCHVGNVYFRDSLDVFFFRYIFARFCRVATSAIYTCGMRSRSRNMRLYLNLFYDQSKFCNFNFKRNPVCLSFFSGTTSIIVIIMGVDKMFALTGIRLQMNLCVCGCKSSAHKRKKFFFVKLGQFSF